jgi:hypothetical protein
MLKFSFKKLNLCIYIVFLFLLTYQNQINASKVDASKYGFNATDATTCLKTALAQAVDTVIIPNMGTDWIITGITLAGSSGSNKVIIFEKGVVVAAKKLVPMGQLFSIGTSGDQAVGASNISFIGYGATIKMQKADYMNPALYAVSQWRHCIGIKSSTGIRILGLTLKESGGDGVAIMYGSKDILIKDVICDNNYRQGMSPIFYQNVTIENCVMINTKGHAPQAGVDFEPNYPSDTQTNGKMINCYLGNNHGGEIKLFFRPLDNTTAPVSLEFKHCFTATSSSSNGGGINLAVHENSPVKGLVSFEDVISECASANGALCVRGKSANSYLTKFTNCLSQNSNPAIGFTAYGMDGNLPLGGLQFVNCVINSPGNQLTIKRDFIDGAFGVGNISGNITVNSPTGVQSQLGTGANVTLQLTEGSKTKPPVFTSVKPDKGNPVKVTDFTAGSPINISAMAYDPDNGTTNGAGIKKVDFAVWRGEAAVASYSDVSAPYEWPVTATKTYGGIYLIRITAYSGDGSYTVTCVPINIYNPAGPGVAGIPGTGIELNHEVWNGLSGKEFLVRNTSEGFLVYSPFSQDSRIVISDLSGRQVTLAQTAKGKSWNNIGAQNKLLSGVYFIQVTESKGNNSIVKKAMIAK